MNSKIFSKGFPLFVERYEKISSTNDVALEYLLKNGDKSNGAVFIANYQEKGRGRLGRNWFSSEGKNLLMSFIFIPPKNYKWNLISLVVGVACIKAIEKYRMVKAKIKWPNDIFFEKRKMGGILVESRMEGNHFIGAVVGIGINIKGSRKDFPKEIVEIATTLEEVSQRECDVREFEEVIFNTIPEHLEFLLKKGSSFIDEVSNYFLHKKGDKIEVSCGDNIFSGKYEGINKNGELIMLTKEEKKSFNCGEIINLKDSI